MEWLASMLVGTAAYEFHASLTVVKSLAVRVLGSDRFLDVSGCSNPLLHQILSSVDSTKLFSILFSILDDKRTKVKRSRHPK